MTEDSSLHWTLRIHPPGCRCDDCWVEQLKVLHQVFHGDPDRPARLIAHAIARGMLREASPK